MKVFKILIALAFVGLLSVGAFLYLNLMPPNSSDETVVIEIEPGKFSKTLQDLYDEGIIADKRTFVLFAKFTGQEAKIKTGEYEIRKNMWPQEILNVFTTGKSIQRSFTISEGLNIFDVSQIIQSKGIATSKEFMSYVMDKDNVRNLLGYEAKSLEGYLFPDTYNYTKSMKLDQIVKMMVARSRGVITSYFPAGTPTKLIHSMITLASIIEKETGAQEERPLISSVFHNRMKIKMRLQTDPTVLYGIAMKTGKFPNNIRKKDLSEPTEYNTYTIYGLPPGPIANPGEEAIRAALKPETSNYIFFVSKNEGRHFFSSTLKEHNDAVREYQMNRKAREGKSWRNLKKSN